MDKLSGNKISWPWDKDLGWSNLDFICHAIFTFKTTCRSLEKEREGVVSGDVITLQRLRHTALAEIHMRAFICVKRMIVT